MSSLALLHRSDTDLSAAGLGAALARAVAPARLAAAGLLVVFAALLALPLQAQAQTLTTFVSNTAQGPGGASNDFQAQRFATGTNTGGYTISEVQVRLNTTATRSTSVKIRENNATNKPGDLVATLTNPGTLTGDSENTFTAPPDTTLDASTNYWISVNEGITISGDRASVTRTTSNVETGETGWSIDNNRLSRNSETANWITQSTGTLVIAVKGTANPTTNTAATGTPSISGTAQVGQTLTAGIGDIADAEDLPSTVFPAGYTFQWVRVDSSNNETDVGTDSSTYSPTSSDVGSTIKVEVSFTDGASNAETVTSDATAVVVAAAVVTVAVSIAAEYASIGAGLEDLVFTLTRQGATTDALEATVTIVQDQSWLVNSDRSHTVTFTAGSATATLTLAASRFSFDPDTSGDLTATVAVAGVSSGEATVEIISTADAPITISYDMSSYTFAEDAADVEIYVVATLDPAYPRAPSRSFFIAVSTKSDTATLDLDYVRVNVQAQFVHGDFAPDGKFGSWPASACNTATAPTSASRTTTSTRGPKASS